MFNKSSFFAALFVLLGFTLRFASATPPACVLACVNQQDEVYNYSDICKADVAEVAACLKKACKSELYDDAVTNYKASCKEANFNVVMPTATPTPTAYATTTTTATHSTTKTRTPTATPSAGNTDRNSTSDSQALDENVASTVYYNSMLALIAVFAAAVAL